MRTKCLLRFLASLILIASLLSVAATACGGGDGDSPTTSNVNISDSLSATDDTDTSQADTATDAITSAPSAGTTVVNLQDPSGSGSYVFDPDELSFSVGETVTFDLTSEKEFHTFTVTDLGINVAVNAGETQTLEFTFDKAGTYNLICVPHQELGMVGTVSVQ